MSMIEKARDLAFKAHKGQRRKYTNTAYIGHPAAVANLLWDMGFQGPVTQAAAWLHDVVEDTPVTLGDIEFIFNNSELTHIVDMLTDPLTKFAANRATRMAFQRDRLARSTVHVQNIKIADMIDNSRSIVHHDPGFAKVYIPEKRDLLLAMPMADPRLLKMAWAIVNDAERDLGIAA